MYPLWDKVVEPVVTASGATRVVEIGALRGENTERMLEFLGPEAELHVIDPLPEFDPEEHSRRFPGRYIFHRDISHNVLPHLPAVDVAFVDGDHNWFTVYHELRMLHETAKAENRPLPVLIMHDVCWPYGRRDLYYEPGRIPEEGRQPYERRGLLPGRSELVDKRGMNPHLANADHEGGPRNGVRTALDDFVAEYDGSLRVVLLPLYYGLAIVAPQERLEASPELVAVLDRLETSEGRYELIELGESIRLDEQVQHHNLHHDSSKRYRRAARLYLNVVKGAVLDEHYLENELRIQFLLECASGERELSPRPLRDPGRYLAKEVRSLEQERRAGELATPSSNGAAPDTLALTQVGRTRLDHLEQCLDRVFEDSVTGDLVDCGTGRGGSGIFLAAYLAGHEIQGPRVWVADRFGGGTAPNEGSAPWFSPDLNTVRDAFARFDLLGDHVRFLVGTPSESLPDAPIDDIALLRIDRQDPEEVTSILRAAYDKVRPGGFVVIDDYGSPECAAAVDAFRSEQGIDDRLERVDWSAASWRKTAGDPAPAEPRVIPELGLSLTVLVVFHDMRREAARTLHSLTRAYQRDIDDLDYEVIAIENGSGPDRSLGEEFVKSFGPEFSYLDLGEDASPSPAHALNRGLEHANGRAIAVMIDGAHVLTPGVLHYGLMGLRTYAPAVVSTQQWYVGPGEQNEVVSKGYDEQFEDRLFKQIGWPVDGYRLFDIGHFIGGRDWFDGQWESNCVFVPRSLLDQVGGMDHDFNLPGGGFANLDFFERMTTSPRISLVTILGEGSFHQVHGGTTTNTAEDVDRSGMMKSYADQYAEIRGRMFKSPAKLTHYIGGLPESARRTKARRMGAPEYFKRAHVEGTDGRPPEPIPVPEELRTTFVDAFWRSKEWHQTPWLGRWTARPATDLMAYQELIVRVRPDWVIETGTGGGGRAFFLATICDLIGQGKVLSIDDTEVPRLAEHDRIEYLRRDPEEADAAAAVRGIVGDRPRGLLILGAAKFGKLMTLYEHYGAMVPVGSYVVVEDTILNGNPVWTGFGPGPSEAARRIIDAGEFERDHGMERYALTFNSGGFLKRIKEPGG